MEIRLAQMDEFDRVVTLYNDVIDALADAEYTPMWQRGVYPTEDSLCRAIEKQELYVGMVGTGMVAAMVVNQQFNEGYRNVQWCVDASEADVRIIHVLCVHPKVKRRGLAKNMVQWVLDQAKKQEIKAVRLDVLKGNVPAERLYPMLGFKYITTERTYYDDMDWMDFMLYECPLEEKIR